MFRVLSLSVLPLIVIALTLGAGTPTYGYGATAEVNFYRAYYLEIEQGDYKSAAELYRQVAENAEVDKQLRDRARQRLEICREDIAGENLIDLMPSNAIGYAEISNPGGFVMRLLKMTGLLEQHGKTADARGKGLTVSPTLVKELLGLKGLAVAITSFDARKEKPGGVAVLHPGRFEVIYGLLETALPAGARSIEPISGQKAYFIEEKGIYVALTRRMVVAGTDQSEVQGVVQRIKGERSDRLSDNPELTDVVASRKNSMVFVCVNVRALVPLLREIPDLQQNLIQAQMFLDIGSFRYVAARLGVDDDGLFTSFAARLDPGHNCIAYNVARTPPITKQTLRCVPKGAVGFVAAALSDAGDPMLQSSTDQSDPSVTGLDLGREVFANIIDFAVYALTPPKDDQSPIPHIAGVIRVRDPSKSEALWTQILNIAALAAGQPTTDDTTYRLNGVETKNYHYPNGITIRVATQGNNMLVASTEHAMRKTLESVKDGASILDDPAFAGGLKQVGDHTSKAVMIHAGRALESAKRYMSSGDLAEAAKVAPLLSRLVASVLTNESEEKLDIHISATGLPDVGKMVAQLIEHEKKQAHMHHQVSSAIDQEQWAKAIGLIDGLIAADPQNTELHRKKFTILAVYKNDRSAANDAAGDLKKAMDSNAQALNNFAWALLTEDQYGGQYDDLALELSEKACEIDGYDSWAYLDTLALAKFRAGDVEAAIEYEKKAIQVHGGDNKALNEALARFEAAKEQQHTSQ